MVELVNIVVTGTAKIYILLSEFYFSNDLYLYLVLKSLLFQARLMENKAPLAMMRSALSLVSHYDELSPYS